MSIPPLLFCCLRLLGAGNGDESDGDEDEDGDGENGRGRGRGGGGKENEGLQPPKNKKGVIYFDSM